MEENTTKRVLQDPMIFNEDQKPKHVNPMVFDVPTKSTEQKRYIVLIAGISSTDDDMFDGPFKILTGRTACFRFIESLCQSYGDEFDAHRSIVITETKQTETATENTKYYLINLEDAISVYAFCKSVEDFYGDKGFKIDDYFNPPTADTPEQDAVSSEAAFKDQAVHRVYQEFLQNQAGAAPEASELPILRNSDEDDGSVNV